MNDPGRRALAADYLASLTDRELNTFVDEARGITEARELVRHLFGSSDTDNRPDQP